MVENNNHTWWPFELPPDETLVRTIAFAEQLGKLSNERMPVTFTTLLVALLYIPQRITNIIPNKDLLAIRKQAMGEKGLSEDDLKKASQPSEPQPLKHLLTTSANSALGYATGYAQELGSKEVTPDHLIAAYLFAEPHFHEKQRTEWGLTDNKISDSFLKQKPQWKNVSSAPPPTPVRKLDASTETVFRFPLVPGLQQALHAAVSAPGARRELENTLIKREVTSDDLAVALLIQKERYDGFRGSDVFQRAMDVLYGEIGDETSHRMLERLDIEIETFSASTPNFLDPDRPLEKQAEHVLTAADLSRVQRTGEENTEIAEEDLLRAVLLAGQQQIDSSGIEVFREVNPDFDIEGALAALLPPPAETMGGFDTDRVQPGQVKADTLELTPQARAFAHLMLDKSVTPPLSIGLFGDWGSGKSFFMGLIQQEADSIADKAKNAPDSFGEVFHDRPVHVHFNAWHYAEDNLWASLVTTIFEKLGERLGILADKQADAEQVFQELESAKQARQDARDQLAQARWRFKATAKNFRDRRAEAESSRSKLHDLTGPGGWREFLPKLTDPEDKNTKLLHKVLGEDLSNFTGELAALSGHGKEFSSHVQATRAAILNWNPGWVVGTGAVIVGFVALAPLSDWIPSDWSLFETELRSQTAELVTKLGVFAVAVGKWATNVNSYAKQIRNAAGQVATKVETSRKKKYGEEKEAYNRAQEQVELAEQQLAEAAQLVEGAERKKREAEVPRRFVRFITERLESGEYEKHLGLITTIRRDFETLSSMMKEIHIWEDASTDEREQNQLVEPETKVRIDRIILYIDDLDRCPPDKVIKVLEAVHLLLSYELFVVLVAVDTRWVHQALLDHYPLTLSDDDGSMRDRLTFIVNDGIPEQGANTRYHGEVIRYDPRVRGVSNGKDEGALEHGSGTLATPHDYLEKIFQIPFWLPPMGEQGSRGLVNELTASAVIRPKVDEAEKHGDDAVEAAKGDKGRGAQETVHPISVPSFEEAAPAQLSFEQHEHEFMKWLSPYAADTPRRLKRFVNVYRFFKAGLSTRERKAFVPPHGTPTENRKSPYRAVLTLLAVITGAPRVAPNVLYVLQNTPKLKTPTYLKDKLKPLYEQADPARSDELDRAIRILESAPDDEMYVDFDMLREWLGPVTRYTFRSGRVLQ